MANRGIATANKGYLIDRLRIYWNNQGIFDPNRGYKQVRVGNDGDLDIQNPYEASTNVYIPRSDALSWTLYLSRVFWFLPGTQVGRELERCTHSGVSNTLKRFEAMNIQSTIELSIFAISCFFLTVLWRLPRRYFVGSTRINSVASFLSGILMMFLAGKIIRLGMMTNFQTQTATIFLSGIIAVEFESILSRLRVKRS